MLVLGIGLEITLVSCKGDKEELIEEATKKFEEV